MKINMARVESLKKEYPVGTRVELIEMGLDPRPIAAGTQGTVTGVDDIGTIHVTWDNGRSLGLICGEDEFRKISCGEGQALQEKIDAYLDEKKLQEGR